MPEVNTVKVRTQRQLKQFIDFPAKLYADCKCWVPALRGDEFKTFDRQKNEAFAFCEADCFLAMRGKEVVGRVAAIVNHRADDADMSARFGWLDFVEDIDVLRSLMDAVRCWALLRGRKVLKGPWGFTDMDKEGLLVEGYEHLSPFTCLYNYPYYDIHLARLGFTKDVDWTQRIMTVSSTMPPMFQYAPLVEERFGIHVVRPRSMRSLARQYGKGVFSMYNEAFAPLAGFSPLGDKQISTYLNTYVPLLDKDFVAVAVDSQDQPVGFLACIPTLSTAIRRAHGHLSPFGLLHIAHALRQNDTLEALIIGVSPKYQACGVPILMFKYVHENCVRRGIRRIILNPQLEENHKVQNLFNDYDTEPFMRRRAYRMKIID